jgi:hypothetical protein
METSGMLTCRSSALCHLRNVRDFFFAIRELRGERRIQPFALQPLMCGFFYARYRAHPIFVARRNAFNLSQELGISKEKNALN